MPLKFIIRKIFNWMGYQRWFSPSSFTSFMRSEGIKRLAQGGYRADNALIFPSHSIYGPIYGPIVNGSAYQYDPISWGKGEWVFSFLLCRVCSKEGTLPDNFLVVLVYLNWAKLSWFQYYPLALQISSSVLVLFAMYHLIKFPDPVDPLLSTTSFPVLSVC